MQSNFISYVRVSSSVSFVASIDEKTINSSENYINRFPSFLKVNCLMIFYSVYCNSCCFKNNNQAVYCTCSSVAPLLLDFFVVGGNWKELENFDLYSCLGIGAQMFFRHKRRKFDTLLSYFIVLVNKIASLNGIGFLSVGHVSG